MTELLHMLTMDTGKSKRTWRTPRKHPTARNTGNLRLGFPQKRPSASEKQLSGGAEPQPPESHSWPEPQGDSRSCWLGGGGADSGGGQNPLLWASCQRPEPSAPARALGTPAGPGGSVWLRSRQGRFHEGPKGEARLQQRAAM